MQKLMTKTDDPNDDRFLTPNRFLIGQMGGDFVREIVETEPFNPKKGAGEESESSQVMSVTDEWKNTCIVPHIGSRQKWQFGNDNLRVGYDVVVIDPGTVRRQWNVERIKQTYSSPEGLVRVVDLRVIARL